MAQHPATQDTAPQHDQAGTPGAAAESASIDVAAITTTIGRVLRPRPGTPARRTCERWHELLKGHLQLLIPIMQKDAEPFAGTDYAELIELAAPFISARVAAPLPADRCAAYAACLEQARQCRAVLGLVLDHPAPQPRTAARKEDDQ